MLKEFQAGFRKAYSTEDNILNLINVVKLKLSSDRKYMHFLNFTAAFDSIDHHALFYKLYELRTLIIMVKVLKHLYLQVLVAI